MMATGLTQIGLMDLYRSLLSPGIFGRPPVGDDFLGLGVKSDVPDWP